MRIHKAYNTGSVDARNKIVTIIVQVLLIKSVLERRDGREAERMRGEEGGGRRRRREEEKGEMICVDSAGLHLTN